MAEGSSLEYFTERPQKPLPSDCCDTGCSPCVMDLYHEELAVWERLRAMSVQERQKWVELETRNYISPTMVSPVLSPGVGYIQFELINIKQMTSDSFLYSFRLPENQVLGVRVGQHVILRMKNGSGHFVTRQFTPVSHPNQKGSFQVLIKIYSNGEITQLIKEQWCVGICAEWRGPFGDFQYQPNTCKKLLMLACGTGIAPMIQVIQAVLDNEDDLTCIQLIYACRTQHDILLKHLLNGFSDYWNFQVLYVLSQCTEEKLETEKGLVRYGDKIKYGRITAELVHAEMSPPSDENCVLVCGTKSFDKDMINYLLKMGYTRKSIFKF